MENMDSKLTLDYMAAEMFRLAMELRDKTTAQLHFQFFGNADPIFCEIRFTEKCTGLDELCNLDELCKEDNLYRLSTYKCMRDENIRTFKEFKERAEEYLNQYVEPEETGMP